MAYDLSDAQSRHEAENTDRNSTTVYPTPTVADALHAVRSDNHIWSSPPSSWVKLNTDASFIGCTKPGGAGAVVRDSNGRVLLAACTPLPRCADTEDAEAKAALVGIRLIQGMGYERVILELDCLAVSKALRSAGTDRSRQWAIYDEAKRLLTNLQEYNIQNVKRECNGVADALASLARSAGSCIWTGLLPDPIEYIVIKETPVNPSTSII
jgi:ribonuclease HI